MKHAYLIIAHGEFKVLLKLISILDDVRNDIYVHFDKKVKKIPTINVSHSNLYLTNKRVDVRWGNVSQIECEYVLLECAYHNGPYGFYHIISGVHFPLKSQSEIHSILASYGNNNIFCHLDTSKCGYFETLKMHRVNLFTRTYASKSRLRAEMSQWLWKLFIAIQRKLNFTINRNVDFCCANNWCCISQAAVSFLVSRKKVVMKRYRWSFCGDEYFVPTELLNSTLKSTVMDYDKLLYCKMGKSNAEVLTMSDYADLVKSDCLFARKFSESNMDLVDAIIKLIL